MLKKGGSRKWGLLPTIFLLIFAENNIQNIKKYDRNQSQL